MKFKKFKKEGNKRKIFVVVAALFMVIGALFIGMSYAMYQTENEIAFINAKVADFRVFLSDITATSTNNKIDLSYTSSGLNATTTCAFGTTKGTYNITADSVNNNKCTKQGLNQNTSYYYKVCTKNNLKQEECKEGSVTTKYDPPTLSEVTATSNTDGITLKYTVGGYADNYLCKWGTREGNYPNIAGMNMSTCYITGLQPGTTYYYEVNVSNNGGGTSKRGSIKTKAKPIVDQVKIGDYISMTPTSTSYTISKDLTGYTRDQTINPSELNLWRVIRKNSDGTIEMVSEYVSSKLVYFAGEEGYVKLVGGLNTIASQYTDGSHVLKTRHMGYHGQSDTCSWVTDSGCIEDSYYDSDAKLVNSAVGTLISKKVGSVNNATYWYASRSYYQDGNGRNTFAGRVVNGDGDLSGALLFENDNSGPVGEWDNAEAVRPIATLKSTSYISSGNGTSGSPYILN